MILWDARSGRLKGALGTHDESVDWLAFSSNGKTLVSISSKNQLVQVWSLSPTRLKKKFKLHGLFDQSTEPVLAPDGRSLANVQKKTLKVGGKKNLVQGELTVWDTLKGVPRWSLPESGVHALAFSPDGKQLAAYVDRTTWYVDEDGDVRGRDNERYLVLWGYVQRQGSLEI